MNGWLHNDKISQLFCYNVPIFPVLYKINRRVYVVIFSFQLILIFLLFFGMVMYVNEFKTKEKPKLTEIKINCNVYIANKFNLKITGVTIALLSIRRTPP